MKKVNIRVVFDRHRKASKKVKAPVSVEVSYDRKRKYYGTSVRVYADQWRDGKVVRHYDSQLLNDEIDAKVEELQRAVRKLKIQNGFSFDLLDAVLSGAPSGDFLMFVQSRINERTDLSEGTARHHLSWLKFMRTWGRIRTFSDLTVENIYKYDTYVCARGVSKATAYNYHKLLKSYINQAVAFGRIDKNPYLGQRFSRGKSSPRVYLTESELSRLCASDMPSHSLERVRDLFVFQCYTGLSYSDLAKFDFSKAEDRSGRWFIHDVRTKTGGDFYLVLLKPAVDVLQRYKWRLPMLSAEKYNLYLKAVMLHAGIDKPATSHCARHTFAVYALNKGVAIEVLAKMLGHTDIKTTQIYAKIVQQSVTDAFLKLESEGQKEGQNQGHSNTDK